MDEKFIISNSAIDFFIGEVERSIQSVLIAVFKFTSLRAFEALVDARQRGLDVRMIVDEYASMKKKSLSRSAVVNGIDVLFWPSQLFNELHTKLYIFDLKRVIFGSFNLTESAEKRNTESCFIADNPSITSQCIEQWDSLIEKISSRKFF